MKLWRYAPAALVLWAMPAFAQQDVIPKYVCGVQSTGQNLYCPPGTGSNGTAGLPVQITGGSGGVVTTTPLAVTPTDRSGTLTAGNTSQTLAAANISRHCLIVQNPVSAAGQNIATAEDLYLNNNAVAAVVGNGANYADLAPGGSASFCFSGMVDQTAITVIATTISHRWYAKEY